VSHVSVLLEGQQPEGFLATALGWSDCHAHGMTEAEALDNLRHMLLMRLQTAKVVSLEIDDEHPLIKLSGMFKDDPQFGAMVEFIERDRQALDQAVMTAAPSEDAWDRMFGGFKGDADFAEIAAEIRAAREVDDDSEVDSVIYAS
jgi:predicted RNase H-like HicB family nuclease